MTLLTYFLDDPVLLFLLSNSYLADFTKKLNIFEKCILQCGNYSWHASGSELLVLWIACLV